MNQRFFNFFTLLLLFGSSISSITEQSDNAKVIPVKDPDNILVTFGSCHPAKASDKSEILSQVAKLHPDAWVWLGGALYFNIKHIAMGYGPAPLEQIRTTLATAKGNSGYEELRNSTRVIGTWDDYDYGQSNGGKKFQYKKMMQQVFLDFLDEPKDSARRQRKGIYESYYLGDVTKVKVILLDIRYSRDERFVLPINAVDMLGDEQWEWLENELKENQAEYVVIASGTQVLPDDRILPEYWHNESKQRLIDLIKKYQVGGVILISGDVNYAEIMKHPCKERVGFELYEFTSSGLIHSNAAKMPYGERFPSIVYPNTWNKNEDKFYGENFGVLKFMFGEKKGIKLEARDIYGRVVLNKFIPYSDLEFNADLIDNTSSCITDMNKYTRFFNHFQQSLLKGEKVTWLISGGLFGALLLVIMLLVVILLIIKWIFKYIFGLLFGKKVQSHKTKTE